MRTLNTKIKVILGCYVFLTSHMRVAADEIISEEELKQLDPATQNEKLQKKLGPTFNKGVSMLVGEDTNSDGQTRSAIWGSTGEFSDPNIGGNDVSNWLDMEQPEQSVGIYRYAAFGKPDPFVAPLNFETTKLVDNMEIPILSPLQTNLGSLKIAGIWSLDDGTSRALILTGNGLGIVAKVGDPIGLTGKIIEIRENGIITRQYSMRTDGTREFVDVPIVFDTIEGQAANKGSEKIILTPGGAPMFAPPTNGLLDQSKTPPSVSPAVGQLNTDSRVQIPATAPGGIPTNSGSIGSQLPQTAAPGLNQATVNTMGVR